MFIYVYTNYIIYYTLVGLYLCRVDTTSPQDKSFTTYTCIHVGGRLNRARMIHADVYGVFQKKKKESFHAVSKLYYEWETIVIQSFRPNYRCREDDGSFRQGCWNGEIWKGREDRGGIFCIRRIWILCRIRLLKRNGALVLLKLVCHSL